MPTSRVKNRFGKRRQRVADLVQRPRDRPRLLERPLDHQADQLLGGERGEPLGERVGGHDLERPGDQELADIGTRHDLGQQIAHLVHLGEALQHRHETAVLALRELEVDDVVVEVVFPVAGGDGRELGARGVDQDGAADRFRR